MGSQIRRAVRFIWFNIGVGLLVLVLLEGVARGYLALRFHAPDTAGQVEIMKRQESDAGSDQSWVGEYLRELDEGREDEWRPYIYWRKKPYRGQYLNINDAGIRQTWNSTTSPVPGQLKVFMFGGSTLWGFGARDEFTIPSLVSRKLAARLGSGAWVTNFAENGYVSTQEVIALMLELRDRNVPDVVVFLDGVNDSFAAAQSGLAGIPQNESNRVAEFNSLKGFSWRQAIATLTVYKLTEAFVRSHSGAPVRFARMDDALASAVVDVYLRNGSIVDALARQFGFRAIFFWQPTIFTKRHLSRQEQQRGGQLERRFPRFGSPGPYLDKVYTAFRLRIRASTIDNVHDLSGVFDEVSGSVFTDEWHVTEAGNEKIAEVMTQTLMRDIARRGRK